MNNTETVQLGGRIFPVVPQKHAKLRKYLKGDLFQRVMSKDYSSESYKILCILIPAIKPENGGMPEWEFDGFTTEEAWNRYKAGDEDAYDEDNDPGPTTYEIIAAIEKALMVGGASRLGKLVDLVTTAGSLSPAAPTGTSLDSPGENGASTSAPTGTPQTT
jgi:hypothetical protein